MGRKESEYRKQLKQQYIKEARLANERLRAMEKLAKKQGFENVTQYAYRVAMRDIKKYSTARGRGDRFTIPKNTNQLERALKDVRKFNEAKTATRRGVISLYKQDAVNFNKTFGTNYTWQELKVVLDDVNWEELKEQYGSPVLVKVIKSMTRKTLGLDKKEKSKVINQVDSSLKKHKNVLGNEVDSEIASKLAANGLTLEKLTSGTDEGWLPAPDDSPFN